MYLVTITFPNGFEDTFETETTREALDILSDRHDKEGNFVFRIDHARDKDFYVGLLLKIVSECFYKNTSGGGAIFKVGERFYKQLQKELTDVQSNN